VDNHSIVIKLPTWLWGIIVMIITGSFVMIPNLYVNDLIASEIMMHTKVQDKKHENADVRYHELVKDIRANDKELAVLNTNLINMTKTANDQAEVVRENQKLLLKLVNRL